MRIILVVGPQIRLDGFRLIVGIGRPGIVDDLAGQVGDAGRLVAGNCR